MVSITREDGDVSNELLSGITDNLKFFIEKHAKICRIA